MPSKKSFPRNGPWEEQSDKAVLLLLIGLLIFPVALIPEVLFPGNPGNDRIQ